MVKYHIKKDGSPGVCRAKYCCPLGSENEHFDSIQKAQEHADYLNSRTEAEKAINKNFVFNNGEFGYMLAEEGVNIPDGSIGKITSVAVDNEGSFGEGYYNITIGDKVYSGISGEHLNLVESQPIEKTNKSKEKSFQETLKEIKELSTKTRELAHQSFKKYHKLNEADLEERGVATIDSWRGSPSSGDLGGALYLNDYDELQIDEDKFNNYINKNYPLQVKSLEKLNKKLDTLYKDSDFKVNYRFSYSTGDYKYPAIIMAPVSSIKDKEYSYNEMSLLRDAGLPYSNGILYD